MILAAATVCIIEHRFRQAALWCFAGALLSASGLMHSYVWSPGDTVLSLAPALPWALGYALVGGLFFAAPWITTPGERGGDVDEG